MTTYCDVYAGPVLLEDYQLVEKIAQFDRERIPERVVHARGASAKGFFEVAPSAEHCFGNWPCLIPLESNHSFAYKHPTSALICCLGIAANIARVMLHSRGCHRRIIEK